MYDIYRYINIYIYIYVYIDIDKDRYSYINVFTYAYVYCPVSPYFTIFMSILETLNFEYFLEDLFMVRNLSYQTYASYL